MKKLIYILISAITIVAAIIIACVNTSKHSQIHSQEIVLESFPFTEVPKTITEPKQKAEYLATHYWDNFNFSDTTLIDRPEITEQGFVDFIDILAYTDRRVAEKAITKMLTTAQANDLMMLHHFEELCYDYLYAEGSPLVNEELYITVLNHMLISPDINPMDKIRPYYLLELMMKNRVDSTAVDFEYRLLNGQPYSLHEIDAEYTILFFSDPDCGDCSRTKEEIDSSQVIRGLMSEKSLVVLSVFSDMDMTEMHDVKYSENWVNGHYPQQYIQNNELYDIKSFPTIYLLDAQKRVILKNTSPERIEDWLNQNEPNNNTSWVDLNDKKP